MDKMVKKPDPMPSSFSLQTLEEIVRSYKRNEQYIHELVRNTRHERKKAEHVLQQIHQNVQERNKQEKVKLKPKRPKSIEFYVSFDNNNSLSSRRHRKKRSILKDGDSKSVSSIFNDTFYSDRSTTSTNGTQRVRFKIPDSKTTSFSSNQPNKSNIISDKLSALERRCKDLLSYLETYQDSIAQDYKIHHSNLHIPVRSHHPNEKHKHCNKLNDKCQQMHSFSHRSIDDINHRNLTQQEETKQISKNIYSQSLKLIECLRQNLMNDNVKLRDSLREEILQLRLRQNALLFGRTYKDTSSVMIDT